MCHNWRKEDAMNRKQRRGEEKTQKKAAKPAAASAGAQDPLTLHASGVQAFRAGQPEQAAQLIAQAIAADGSKPDFHYNLGFVLKSQGKLEEAAACYARAIALKPDYADAHNNLGNVFKELGRRDDALASLERAVRLKPDKANTHYNLGMLWRDAVEQEKAVHHLRRSLECDPDDPHGIRMVLAHLDQAATPDRASEAQLQKIYKVRAGFWDSEDYFGHALVAEAFKDHLTRANPDILDIGCGTGLVGAQVRPLARRLDGVDLSDAMLEKARQKQIYDRLERADLVSFMADNPGSYDAVLGAATLIHFGDLRSLFQAAHLCLREQGLFVFTLFPNESDDSDFAVSANDKLAQNGCFRHSTGYVGRLAGETGFSVPMLKTVIHEHNRDGSATNGLLVVLRRD